MNVLSQCLFISTKTQVIVKMNVLLLIAFCELKKNSLIIIVKSLTPALIMNRKKNSNT